MPPGHPGYPGQQQQQFPGAMHTGGANPFMMPPTGQVIQTNTFLAGPTGMADPMGGGTSGLLLPGPQANAQAATNRGLAASQPGVAPSASNPFAQAMVTGGLDDLSVGALGIIPDKEPTPQAPMRAMGGMTGGSMDSGANAGPSGGASIMASGGASIMGMGAGATQSGLLLPAGSQSAPTMPAAPSGLSASATGGSATSAGAPGTGQPPGALPNAFMQQPQHANYAGVAPTGAPGQQFMPPQPQFQGSVTGFSNLGPQGQHPYYGGGFPGQAPNAQFYGGVTGPPGYGGGGPGGYSMPQQQGYAYPQGHQAFPGQSGPFGGPPQQQYQPAGVGQPFGAPQHQMGHFQSAASGPAAPQAMAAPWSNAFQ